MPSPVVYGKFPFRPAHVVSGSWRLYVRFDVFDIEKGTLVRKIVSSLKGDTVAAKIEYGEKLATRINGLLESGYVVNPAAYLPVVSNSRRFIDVLAELSLVIGARGGQRSVQAWDSFARIVSVFLVASELDGLALADVKREHIINCLDWLTSSRSVGSRTRNNYLSSFKSLFKECIAREWVVKSPADGIEDVHAPQQTHVAYSSAEATIIENWLKENDMRLYVLTRFIYYGFIRPVELSRLRISDIDMFNGTISVRSTASKSKTADIIPMIKPLREIVLGMDLANKPLDWYLFGKDFLPAKTAWHPNRYTERYRVALEAVGLYGLGKTLYSWKHTGNAAGYRAGLTIRQLMQLNRHKSESDTIIYLRSLVGGFDEELRGKSW